MRRLGQMLAAIMAATSIAGVPQHPATADTDKTALTVGPGAGSSLSQVTVSTPGPCPGGTHTIVRLFGAGFPADGYNVVANSPLSAYPNNANGGLEVPLMNHFAAFAEDQSPPATLGGRYRLELTCRNGLTAGGPAGSGFATFVGWLTFSSTTQYLADVPTQSAPPAGGPTPSESTPADSSSAAGTTSSAGPDASGSGVPASPALSAAPAGSPDPARGSATPAASPTVTATDASGAPLPANPVLAPGQQITIKAAGFRVGETVTATLGSSGQKLAPVVAGGDGLGAYGFAVPSDLKDGTHTLVLAGAKTRQVFQFTLGAAVAAAGPSAGVSRQSPRSQSALPRTGSDLTSLALLGAMLLAAGILVTRVARRLGFFSFGGD